MTPLAKDELAGPRGEGYRRMIEGSVAKRAGTPTKSVRSARCSWDRTAVLSRAVTSSWMAGSPPPTGTARSPKCEANKRAER